MAEYDPSQYEGMKVAELKAECKARSLHVGGNKAELVERLVRAQCCVRVRVRACRAVPCRAVLRHLLCAPRHRVRRP